MSRKSDKPRVRLTRAEKKQIAAIMRKARGDSKRPSTAQQTIPYQRMWPDGICRVSDRTYTKTVQFQDINYQLAQKDDKDSIFGGWCDFLNYFDSSIHFQLCFLNRINGEKTYEQSVRIPPQDDEFNSIREEYAQMLQNQLAKGNNGLTKTKFLTFAVEADNLKLAKPRLERVEADLLNNFKRLGVPASPLDGRERLRLMHDMLHMDDDAPFQFEWKWLVPTGLSTKDFIAPSSFDFRDRSTFGMGGKYASVSFCQVMASELKDHVLADFLSMESNMVISMHIQGVDQATAIKELKRKLTSLNQMKIDEQKRAVRSGYDMDIIPADIETDGGATKDFLDALQSRDERMMMLTILMMNVADTRKQLLLDRSHLTSIAQQHNCPLVTLDFQQEDGMASCLPLGMNKINIQRSMTTSATAIFVPFITQELFQRGKEALYYGLNGLSNNLIMVDRKKLKNPNGLILGTPGSGKSFAAKREITNCFLLTEDDIIICDPENEYAALVERLHGQVIRVSSTSSDYINPMDINLSYGDDDSPISMKSDFILSMLEVIAGGKYGLQPIEKTIIDRAVRRVYQPYLNHPKPENMPILGDLYNVLLEQNEKEAQHLATTLEMYVSGSLNVFNHRTNIDIQNRMVCYDIKELGQNMKLLGMLVVQDQVWSRVTQNRAAGKATRYYMDEFHLLLKDEQTAAYSTEIWKRFRKWGGVPTGITQNVKDFLDSRAIENILENSDFIYMLNQGPEDRRILANRLGISEKQLEYVTNSSEGEGLMVYGNIILPFRDRFPSDTELYRIMTTKLHEVHQEGEKKK